MRRLLGASAMAVGLTACGGSALQVAEVTSPFTTDQSQVFEDGVDFVADPDVLSGRWRDDWSRDFQARVAGADLIAVVHVHTLRTDTDLDRRTTFRIVAAIRELKLGEAPEDELSLPVHEGDGGFDSIESNQRRILETDFLAFIKWYTADGGRVAPHWHLSPATDPIVQRAEFLIRRRRGDDGSDSRGRVIVVEHD